MSEKQGTNTDLTPEQQFLNDLWEEHLRDEFTTSDTNATLNFESPLGDVLGPVGVRRVEGEVAGIDLTGQAVSVKTASEQLTLPYDRLVFALGSQLLRPNIPGLVESAFDVDHPVGAEAEDLVPAAPEDRVEENAAEGAFFRKMQS